MADKYKKFASRKAMAQIMENRKNIKDSFKEDRVKKSRGGGVGIQTHGNKLAKALNTKRPDQSLFQNKDGYLTGGIKIRS